MVRDYELAYIMRPDLDETGITTSVGAVKALIEARGGEVVRTALWGKRRLAYEINKIKDGYYAIAEVRLEPDSITEIDRGLALNESIFRHMVIQHEGPIRDPLPDEETLIATDGAWQSEDGDPATSPSPALLLEDDDDPHAVDDENEEE